MCHITQNIEISGRVGRTYIKAKPQQNTMRKCEHQSPRVKRKKRELFSLPARPAVGGYDGVVGVYCGLVGRWGLAEGGTLDEETVVESERDIFVFFFKIRGRGRRGGEF